MEKQNKGARQKKKKEETIRIRTLVGMWPYGWSCDSHMISRHPTDNAYACDPRIKRYKEIEKEKKESQKRAKEEAIKEEARKKEEVWFFVYHVTVTWLVLLLGKEKKRRRRKNY